MATIDLTATDVTSLRARVEKDGRSEDLLLLSVVERGGYGVTPVRANESRAHIREAFLDSTSPVVRAFAVFSDAFRENDKQPTTQICTEAAPHVIKAAQNNDPIAQFVLAQMHQNGLGISADGEKAHELFISSGNSGFIPAFWTLANLEVTNQAEKIKWYERGVKGQDATCQYELGHLYAADSSKSQQAEELLNQASIQDSFFALTSLTEFYVEAPHDTRVNLSKAFLLCAATIGHPDGFGGSDLYMGHLLTQIINNKNSDLLFAMTVKPDNPKVRNGFLDPYLDCMMAIAQEQADSDYFMNILRNLRRMMKARFDGEGLVLTKPEEDGKRARIRRKQNVSRQKAQIPWKAFIRPEIR